jgi:hypothetical protein
MSSKTKKVHETVITKGGSEKRLNMICYSIWDPGREKKGH